MDGVPGVAVAEVVLDEAEVISLVGKRESAGAADVRTRVYGLTRNAEVAAITMPGMQ